MSILEGSCIQSFAFLVNSLTSFELAKASLPERRDYLKVRALLLTGVSSGCGTQKLRRAASMPHSSPLTGRSERGRNFQSVLFKESLRGNGFDLVPMDPH